MISSVKLFSVASLLLACLSSSEAGGHHAEQNAYPKYTFSHGVNDGHTGDKKSHTESRDGDVVTGQYTIADPDGTTRTVQYTADKGGFRAHVVRAGTPVYPPAGKGGWAPAAQAHGGWAPAPAPAAQAHGGWAPAAAPAPTHAPSMAWPAPGHGAGWSPPAAQGGWTAPAAAAQGGWAAPAAQGHGGGAPAPTHAPSMAWPAPGHGAGWSSAAAQVGWTAPAADAQGGWAPSAAQGYGDDAAVAQGGWAPSAAQGHGDGAPAAPAAAWPAPAPQGHGGWSAAAPVAAWSSLTPTGQEQVAIAPSHSSNEAWATPAVQGNTDASSTSNAQEHFDWSALATAGQGQAAALTHSPSAAWPAPDSQTVVKEEWSGAAPAEGQASW